MKVTIENDGRVVSVEDKNYSGSTEAMVELARRTMLGAGHKSRNVHMEMVRLADEHIEDEE